MSKRFTGKIEVVGSVEGVVLSNAPNVSRITLDGNTGNVTLGANGQDGDLIVNDTKGKRTVHIDGQAGDITLGGNGHDGDLVVRDAKGKQTVHINGQVGNITLGANGQDGDLVVNDAKGKRTVHIDGQAGNITLGANGHDGDLVVNDAKGKRAVHIDGQAGNITLGGNGHDGDLTLVDSSGKTTIHLDGDAGDIVLKNADCAEYFDISCGNDAQPGAVMSIGLDGSLRPCLEPYEKNVVGVVSGAGEYRPGIILDQQSSHRSRTPIALMGKVFCNIDAGFGAIRPGDLLTTSPTLGYAMKVTDEHQACGAIIGKALQPLAKGRGKIPIVIALQ